MKKIFLRRETLLELANKEVKFGKVSEGLKPSVKGKLEIKRHTISSSTCYVKPPNHFYPKAAPAQQGGNQTNTNVLTDLETEYLLSGTRSPLILISLSNQFQE